MKIAGVTATGLSRTDAGTAPALGNWRNRLANATSLSGYATVDLRPLDRTPFVPLASALDQAQQNYAEAATPAWESIGRHLLNLKVLGVQTLSLRAEGGRVFLVLVRVAPDGVLELDEAVGFHQVLTTWADTLSDYLPAAKLSDKAQGIADRAKDWTGKYTGNESVGWAAAKIVSVIAGSGGQGCCVTVHPASGPVSDDYVAKWGAADLTTERFISPKIQCSNYLWDLSQRRLAVGGSSGLENPLDWNFTPQAADLQVALGNVTDQ
jgi:hypothetical protein